LRFVVNTKSRRFRNVKKVDRILSLLSRGVKIEGVSNIKKGRKLIKRDYKLRIMSKESCREENALSEGNRYDIKPDRKLAGAIHSPKILTIRQIAC
jgi:hypothetical protein